jgi:diguanylate cyclase (GGDEF)-like protein
LRAPSKRARMRPTPQPLSRTRGAQNNVQPSVPQLDISSVVVTFQAVGTLLLALIIFQLARIFVFRYALTWGLAWTALAFGIMSVRLFILTGSRVTWVGYLVGEWLFLLLLWRGCRELAGGSVPRRAIFIFIPVAIAIAAGVASIATTFNTMFIGQAAVMAAGVGASFLSLSSKPATRATRTVQLALLVMTFLYASYVPLYWIHEHRHELHFVRYSSLVDLLADVFLGCAMILVTAEAEKRELNAAVAALAQTQEQLERRLQTDPLTEVMSRHAFHVMRDGKEVTTGTMQGVVAMIDIDRLKKINDEMGHAAGDVVIRAAANAVRLLIRADDLLFRFGGDEFVAIMPNMTADVVRSRFRTLDTGLTARTESGFDIPFDVSWGQAEFGAERSLDEAIKQADAEMYASRREAS